MWAKDSKAAERLYQSAVFLNAGYATVLLAHVLTIPRSERRRPLLWLVPLLSISAQIAQRPYMQDKPKALVKIAVLSSIQCASLVVCLLAYL